LFLKINTDLLGTFSGEVARIKLAYNTVWQRCLMAMDISGCDIAIASEGSFDPYPIIFFASANDEL